MPDPRHEQIEPTAETCDTRRIRNWSLFALIGFPEREPVVIDPVVSNLVFSGLPEGNRSVHEFRDGGLALTLVVRSTMRAALGKGVAAVWEALEGAGLGDGVLEQFCMRDPLASATATLKHPDKPYLLDLSATAKHIETLRGELLGADNIGPFDIGPAAEAA